jgi:hypothetical protein
MANAGNTRGMIAVDKMGTKVLFLNPATYETEVVLDDFSRTVHELLVVPETGLAYVPIFGDGIHGRNPNPGHLFWVAGISIGGINSALIAGNAPENRVAQLRRFS